MDPAPAVFDDLPRDPDTWLPVPFACGTSDWRTGAVPSAAALDSRRVTQCALSRICGVCGSSLGRPLAFLGSHEEEARNAFHFPPAHVACADRLAAAYAGTALAVLGQPEPLESWVLVTTASFEYQRPSRLDRDRRGPTFALNGLLGRRDVR